MFKKISKRLLLLTSVLASGVVGFLFNDNQNSAATQADLKTPIFSIDKAYADGAGGDCSCSSCDVPPYVESSFVRIDMSQY